jgi:hypothetical protein
MNTHLIRTHGTVMDGWPILVAFALYLVVRNLCNDKGLGHFGDIGEGVCGKFC